MRIAAVHIRHFKSIEDMHLADVENALILVGKNNTGKTAVLDAVRALGGSYVISEMDFNEKKQNIEIEVWLSFTDEDLRRLHAGGIVSGYKRYDLWLRDFMLKLPSYEDGRLHFVWSANHQGDVRFSDGHKKDNKYIRQVLPKLYFIDAGRDLSQLQDDLLLFQEDGMLKQMRANRCMFDGARECIHCFQCIGLINQKTPEQLSAFEAIRLLEYKLYHMNLDGFSKKVNDYFHKNGGSPDEIRYSLNYDADSLCQIRAELYHRERGVTVPVTHLGKGMRSIYMLSLLEAYVDAADRIPSIILVEDPEIFLHPKLQKMTSEILYRLSRKNQVIFSTHSPNLLFNFTTRQIRQIVVDASYHSIVRERTDIGAILDDLGYSANDLMNVSFVFIVEGKQDKNRLPLLLQKYYSEIRNPDGSLARVAIIATNSCTNIKTYANLKYINQVYLQDQFLMIRDGDGQDAQMLARQLCRYYDERSLENMDRLPKVTPRNVLILKYYSFENYFLNPDVMAQLGVIESVEEFYDILLEKWQEYLYRLKSGRHFTEVTGKNPATREELAACMEEIKIYVRGHNLFDIFYGRFREQETELLHRYIELAPREDFADILDAVERFIYFDSRKKDT